jgi:hypothetical protein
VVVEHWLDPTGWRYKTIRLFEFGVQLLH